jgi:hypothetical protein
MKNTLLLVLVFLSFKGFSQSTEQKAKTTTFGFGINIIDNTGTFKSQFLNSEENWNISPSISIVSIETQIGEFYALEFSGSFNKISANKIQNATTIDNDFTFIGLDVNGKFYFDEFIAKNSRFDAYFTAGVGTYSSDSKSNQTANTGMGFTYWFEPNLGLRIQTIGKYAFDIDQVLNNHIQHSAELVFKF